MKIKFSVKQPDIIDDIFDEAPIPKSKISFDEIESITEDLKKFITYGEYIDLIYDTELKTMTVVKKGT
jgi:hypothetical protein